ncbi:MAG TPA: SUMF1/EgtB/PvdO family nonheme iron enzyme [Bryobacteraceae bacterium]|nr:SUMF1/EgtB/PvdO family nonheme iron enzyme [Bryobacteraceae bacterium]
MLGRTGKRLLTRAVLCCIAPALAAQTIDFQRDVEPILEKNCAQCHGTGAHVDFSTRAKAIAGGWLNVGQPGKSSFFTALQNGSMPPGGKLTPSDLEVIKQWITQGAVWPAEITLKGSAAPAKSASGNGEMADVAAIRSRIIANKGNPAGTKAYKVTVPNTTVAYDMVAVPAGEYTMGSDAAKDEQPKHKVSVPGFWMQAHEVTWDEYRLFMFANQAGEVAHKDSLVDAVSRPTRPYVEMSFGMGINGYPAISMTQHAANKYAEWLSAKTGEFYRLPTEAEWEYACRAGTETPYSFGSDAAKLGDYAWYSANSGGKYQKVATKKANAWGLFDMMGNVMEWTLDAYGPYKAGEQKDPWVKPTAPYPITARGGSWNDPAPALTCAARVASDPSWKQQDPQLPKSIWYETDAQWLGFRLIRPQQVPSAEDMYHYWNNGVEHDEQ